MINLLIENDFRSVGNINCDGKYVLRLELINELLHDISDELYTITNNIENIGRIAEGIGCKDARKVANNIVNSLDSILNIKSNYEWKNLIDNLNLLSEKE